MKKKVFNSFIKNSKSSFLWYNILSAELKNGIYLIEYKIFYNNSGKGKELLCDFIYTKYLKDFPTEERSLIDDMIKNNHDIVQSEKTVVAAVTIV